MQRRASWQLYIFSFLITLLVFSLGLSFGLVIEKERLQEVDKINLEQQVGLKSLQLQQLYLEYGDANCDAMNKILEANIQDLFESMNRVIEFNKKSLIDEELFDYQLRDYFLTEMQFLMFSKEIGETCGSDSVTVVYFYNADETDVQGEVLDYLKNIFDERLLVFSFDSNFEEEPMIAVLLESEGVEEFPTLIVNDVIYDGGLGAEDLKEIICEELEEKPVECLIETLQ